jgi:hypothetical protein
MIAPVLPRATAALLMLVVIGLLAAGCGSTVTKHDYIARADAICAAAVRQTRSIPPPVAASSAGARPRALAQYVRRVTPIAASELAQLQSLKRPHGSVSDTAALSRYLVALRAAVDHYRALGAAAAAGDAGGVRDAEASLAGSRVTALASAYGLRACGTPGGTGV